VTQKIKKKGLLKWENGLMNSEDKEVDLEENLKDRVKLCCLENLATTGLILNTIINALALTADIVEEKNGK
jgi:hypothetical protein